jgi:micrococcal nuclease
VKALLIGFALAIAVGLAVIYFQRDGDPYTGAVVDRVLDGDTIRLVGGQRVRLVQIDTPEQGTECYGHQASAAARRILPRGTRVRIEQDPSLDQVDEYQRTLAFVFKGDEAVNVTLVREGAAGVWFFGGARGRHAPELLEAATEARLGRKGLWSACPQARFNPLEPISSGPS